MEDVPSEQLEQRSHALEDALLARRHDRERARPGTRDTTAHRARRVDSARCERRGDLARNGRARRREVDIEPGRRCLRRDRPPRTPPPARRPASAGSRTRSRQHRPRRAHSAPPRLRAQRPARAHPGRGRRRRGRGPRRRSPRSSVRPSSPARRSRRERPGSWRGAEIALRGLDACSATRKASIAAGTPQ